MEISMTLTPGILVLRNTLLHVNDTPLSFLRIWMLPLELPQAEMVLMETGLDVLVKLGWVSYHGKY